MMIMIPHSAYSSSDTINIVKNHEKDVCKKSFSKDNGLVYICKDIQTKKRYLAQTEPVMTYKVIVNNSTSTESNTPITAQPYDDNVSKSNIIKSKDNLLYLDYANLCFKDNDTGCIAIQKNFNIQNITTTFQKKGWEISGFISSLSPSYITNPVLQALFYDKKGNSIAGYVGENVSKGVYPDSPVPFDLHTIDYHVHPFYFALKVSIGDNTTTSDNSTD